MGDIGAFQTAKVPPSMAVSLAAATFHSHPVTGKLKLNNA
jgi:hypothetical protein